MIGKGRFTKKAQVKGKFQAKGGSNNASHSINDYNYYLGLAKQASDYETPQSTWSKTSIKCSVLATK